MNRNRFLPTDLIHLRKRAEQKLRANEADPREPLSSEDTRHLLHELRVHQIELEMQNEELRRAQEELEATRVRYFNLYDLAPVGYIVLSEKGLILEANLRAASLFGVPRADLLKSTFSRLIVLEDQELYYRGRNQLFKTREPQVFELRFVKKDGAPFWAQVEANAAQAADGAPLCHAILSDISEHKRDARILKDSLEYSDRIVNTIREPLLVLNADFSVRSANRSFYWTFKVKPEETERRSLFDLGHRQWEIPKLREQLKELLSKNIAFDDFMIDREFPNIGPRTMLLNGRKIPGESGSVDMILITIDDITERRKLEKALEESRTRFEYKSFHDSLTGLYNRDYFSEQIVHLGKDLRRTPLVSILLIDIDGLKIVNDTLGHKAGDDLLICAAKIISESFRQVDIIARIGGDEFCIILIGVDYKAALAKKNKLFKSISLYNNAKGAVPLHMSVGVATSLNVPGETLYGIYQRADENMYEYKLIQAGSQNSKVIDMLLSALSERDFVAQGHAERLSVMAQLIAGKIQLSDDQTKNLILLAKVHDLGKVGIPDKILFKPRKLSEDEFQEMKKHSQIGYNLASRSKQLFHISDLILHHHEFWDGSGYTQGLKGDQIPLECRIFSIMDAFDAMTNTRPYRKGISKKRAIKELQRCAGTQFEPQLVDEFIEFVELAHQPQQILSCPSR
jgi:diguanylate cyclase (GGDEF)-like protein/PAS domain S-box-containing protein